MSMFFHLYVILLESRRDLETLPRRFSPIYFSIRQRYDPLKKPHASIDTLGRPQGKPLALASEHS